MSPEFIKTVMDEISKTNKVAGHGLGLRFTMGYIKKNGYSVDIDSKVGSHTVFTLSIPLAAVGMEADAA